MIESLRIEPFQDSTHSVEDLTALLHRAYAKHLEQGLHFTATDQSAETTASRLRSGAGFVVLREPELIGTFTLKADQNWRDTAPTLYQQENLCVLSQFGIEPHWQGHGIGRWCLNFMVSWCQEQGITRLAIDTSEGAHALIAMYERWGFEHHSYHQWPAVVNYRSVVMVKQW